MLFLWGGSPGSPWLPLGLHPVFPLAPLGSPSNWTATDEKLVALVTRKRPAFMEVFLVPQRRSGLEGLCMESVVH